MEILGCRGNFFVKFISLLNLERFVLLDKEVVYFFGLYNFDINFASIRY